MITRWGFGGIARCQVGRVQAGYWEAPILTLYRGAFDEGADTHARPLWYKDDCIIIGVNGVLHW